MATETDSVLGAKEAFILPQWTRKVSDKQGRKVPQTIAHRGFKAEYPENTMGAFRGAAEVGSDAIETDIHLSKDGVVVLSHDATLKRCFGIDKKIIDCDWEYLSKLKTTKTPHQNMPRLTDLLEWLAEAGNERLWVLLDIKIDVDPVEVMQQIDETIQSATPNPKRAWKDRIVLGIWMAKYLPLCLEICPGFPVTHIGVSTSYARQFLQVPNVSFNLLQESLMGPLGRLFIRDARKAHRVLFVWTVNDVDMMKWSISKGVDGVITDNPKKFRKVLDDYDETKHVSISLLRWLDILRVNIFVGVISILFWWKRVFKENRSKIALK